MKVRRWISRFIEESSVKSEIYLENREMLEILLDTVDGQDFFCEDLSGYPVCSGFYPSFIVSRRVDLADPSCIPVAGCPDEEMLIQVPEMKAFEVVGVDFVHDSMSKS